MKIYGTRHDGAQLLDLGGGLGVIMRGSYATKPYDLEHLNKMGPWAPADNSLSERRKAQSELEKARATPLSQFTV